MSWVNLPLSSGLNTSDTIGNWAFFNQFYEAIQERLNVFSSTCGLFPPGNVWWRSGPITSITDNGDGTATLTTSADLGTPELCTGNYGGLTCPDTCYVPSNYDVIFLADPTDPLTMVRSTVTSSTSTPSNTLTVHSTPLKDAVVAKFISSISSLAGTTFYLIKEGGLFPYDRRPTKPADQEIWKGTAFDGFSTTVTWDATDSVLKLSDISGTPFLPCSCFYIAVATGGTQSVGTIGINSDHTFSDSANNLIPANHVIWTGATIYVAQSVVDGSGVGQLTQYIDDYNPDPYNNPTGPVITWKHNQFTGKDLLVHGSEELLHRYPIVGNDANTIYFGTVPSIGYSPPLTSLSVCDGKFVIVGSGKKGMPNREPYKSMIWYQGVKNDYISHAPDDGISSIGKPAFEVGFQEDDGTGNCDEFYHECFDIDVQIPLDDDCECGRAGDFLAPDLYKTWRMLQTYVLGMCGGFLNSDNIFGDGTVVRFWTAATILAACSINSWTTTVTVDPTTHIATVGSTNSAPYFPIQVYYTVLDSHSGNQEQGFTSMAADGTLGDVIADDHTGFSIVLSFGFTRRYRRRFRYLYPKTVMIPDCDDDDGCADPPAITPGGLLSTPTGLALGLFTTGGTLTNTTYGYRVSAVNLSGETLACSEVTLAIAPAGTTYRIKLTWNAVVGATGYKIYGRTSGSELHIADTSALTFVDDGTITPTGALPSSNTTHNDCWGAGIYIKRTPSTGYLVHDGGGIPFDGPDFVDGELARYVGDNFADGFSGEGLSETAGIDSSYWDHFYRGTYAKATQAARDASRTGVVTIATPYSILDKNQHWWNDGINLGTARIQGGVATGGGSTSLSDSGYATGQKSCWFSTSRFDGIDPYEGFILEIYSGGMPIGWTTATDGTATYSGPTTTLSSSTTNPVNPPTIATVDPSKPVASGLEQTFVVHGDNFISGCSVTLTDVDDTLTYTPTFTYSSQVLVCSFAFAHAGNWSVKVSNPAVGGASPLTATKTFTTQALCRVPITGFASGTMSFASTTGVSAASGDGYLIREPQYECNKWQGRMVQLTKPDLTTIDVPITYSDDQSIFFAPQTFTPVGDYLIKEYRTGVVFKWSTSTSKWVEPTGSDPRGEPFRKNLAANLETVVADYGTVGDMDDFTHFIPNEMQAVIKKMKWTAGTYSGTANGEDNAASFQGALPGGPVFGWDTTGAMTYPDSDYGTAWGHALASLAIGWSDGAADDGSVPGLPFVDIQSETSTQIESAAPQNGIAAVVLVEAESQYAYLVTSPPTCLFCSVDYAAYGEIPYPGGVGLISDWPEKILNVFNPEGVSLSYHEWSIVASTGVSNAATRMTGKLGVDFTSPPGCTQPDDPIPHQSPGVGLFESSHINEGFQFLFTLAIYKWDVSGGLQYL